MMIRNNHEMKVVVIEKDARGGICLIRGCIPSKLLIYTTNFIRPVQNSSKFGIHTEIKRINFEAVMQRMRSTIDRDINTIRNGLSSPLWSLIGITIM